MAFMEGFKKFMGMSPLDDGIEDDEDERDEFDGTPQSAPVQQGFYGSEPEKLDQFDPIDDYSTTSNYQASSSIGSYTREESSKVVNIHQGSQPQVVLLKPERFEEATSIADHLQAKRTVVVNTDSVSQDVRRRLIDFLSGVAYAEGGTVKQASNTTFVITPNNVGMMGESVTDETEDAHGGTFY